MIPVTCHKSHLLRICPVVALVRSVSNRRPVGNPTVMDEHRTAVMDIRPASDNANATSEPGREIDLGRRGTGAEADEPESGIDGRHLRRQRNIEAVLDAVIDLSQDGVMNPSWEASGAAAGVSARSIQRYFPARSDLMSAALDRVMDRTDPIVRLDDVGEGPLERRIVQYVDRRIDLHQSFGPLVRSAFRQHCEVRHPSVVAAQKLLREQIEAQFAPELDQMNDDVRRRIVALLDVAFQFEGVEHLSNHCELSDGELKKALRAQLSAHLCAHRR